MSTALHSEQAVLLMSLHKDSSWDPITGSLTLSWGWIFPHNALHIVAVICTRLICTGSHHTYSIYGTDMALASSFPSHHYARSFSSYSLPVSPLDFLATQRFIPRNIPQGTADPTRAPAIWQTTVDGVNHETSRHREDLLRTPEDAPAGGGLDAPMLILW